MYYALLVVFPTVTCCVCQHLIKALLTYISDDLEWSLKVISVIYLLLLLCAQLTRDLIAIAVLLINPMHSGKLSSTQLEMAYELSYVFRCAFNCIGLK